MSVVILLVSVFSAVAPAENAPVAIANSDETYRTLRNIGLDSGEAVSLENVALTREFATFRFKRGTVFFVAPVLGKIRERYL